MAKFRSERVGFVIALAVAGCEPSRESPRHPGIAAATPSTATAIALAPTPEDQFWIDLGFVINTPELCGSGWTGDGRLVVENGTITQFDLLSYTEEGTTRTPIPAAAGRSIPAIPESLRKVFERPLFVSVCVNSPSIWQPREEASPLLNLEDAGCFAWSSSQERLACIEDLASIAQGCRRTLVFLGARESVKHNVINVPPQCLDKPTPALSPSARAEVEARLERGFTALPNAIPTLRAGDSTVVGGATIAFSHEKIRSVAVEHAGSWDVFKDVVQVRCASLKSEVFQLTVEGAHEPEVRIVDLGSPWLAVSYSVAWGIEGDIGGRTEVALVNGMTCKVHRP